MLVVATDEAHHKQIFDQELIRQILSSVIDWKTENFGGLRKLVKGRHIRTSVMSKACYVIHNLVDDR
jgi:hypothetical protein